MGGDGAVGLTYEHSPAEGPPITQMMDHIVDYMWVLLISEGKLVKEHFELHIRWLQKWIK